MKIKVKVTGVLEDYLPTGSSNPMQMNINDGATPMDVVRRLRFSVNDRFLISVNGDVVPHSEQSSQVLGEDDSISIMPPLKGG